MYIIGELLGYIAGVCTAVVFLPQSIKTLKTKNVDGLSLSTYVIYNIGMLAWILYGVYLHSLPMIIFNSISFIFSATILYMIIAVKSPKTELRALKSEDTKKLYEFFQQLPASENGKNNTAHGLSYEEFTEWVKKQIDYSKGKNLPDGYVPSTTYVLYINEIPVGVSNLRHHLCPALEIDGGHIGTHVLPKYRGKGYGNIIKHETLKKAKEIGIKSVLIFNHDDNIPAWKSSEKMGGKLDSINLVNGIKIRKYIFNTAQIN
mgnify:CR=1 FL=1